MSEAAARYKIRTVADFFAVPAERRCVMVREFGQWMETFEAARLIFGDALKNWPPAEFEWIDDDLGQGHITITSHESGETLADGVMQIGDADA